MPENPNKILVFKVGSIGDVLLTTPLIRALSKQFPSASIDYLTGSWSKPALQGNPYINHIHTLEDEKVRKKNIPYLLKRAKSIRKQGYQLTFVLDPSWQAGIYAILLGGYRIGFNRNNEGVFHHRSEKYDAEPKENSIPHDIDRYLRLGVLGGARGGDRQIELTTTEQDVSYAKKLLQSNSQPKVVIIPGGARNPYQDMPERRWSNNKYIQLTDELNKKGVTVIVCGSKQDHVITKPLEKSTKYLVGKTNLAQAKAVIEQSDLVITHDTALMHLTASTGVPIIALFGPTDPKRKKPLGDNHHIIWKAKTACYQEGKLINCTKEHDMNAISVEEVLSAVSKYIA